MDAARSAATGWTSRGAGVAGAENDGVAYWDSGSSAQGGYAEQPYEPLSPHTRKAPRGSKWDVPAGYGVNTDVNTGDKNHPPPVGVEPPYKKTRNTNSEYLGGIDYKDETDAGYGAELGYGESFSGSLYDRSGPDTGLTSGAGSARAYGASVEQGYEVPGGQSYTTAVGTQQLPPYGSSMSGTSPFESGTPNYGFQQLPQQTSSGLQHNFHQTGSGTIPLGPGGGRGRGLGSLFYKTKLCTKFKLGICTFNENCNFAHGMEELRTPPPGWEARVASFGGTAPAGRGAGSNPAFGIGQRLKTRLCRFFVDGNCPYGDRCTFLHGDREVQQSTGIEGTGSVGRGGGPAPLKPSFKTRLCSRWEKGEACDFGEKCHFAHGLAELQRYGTNSTIIDGGASVGVATAIFPDQNTMHNVPAPSSSTLQLYQKPKVAASSSTIPQSSDTKADVDYGYWNEEKWEAPSFAGRQLAIQSQGYAQGDQSDLWTSQYGDDEDEEAGLRQYSYQQPQQQQTVPFFRGGGKADYSGLKQDLSTSYRPDDVQAKYQGATRNGEFGYFQGGSSDVNYPGQ